MSVTTPNTTFTFLNVPLEIDYNHQLNFSNTTAQRNYFTGITGSLTVNSCNYQRKDGFVRVPASFDSLYNYNYVMYQNTSYSNKWYYAFITKKEYMNDNMTKVYIETDVWQTYQFDLTFKKCFIDREHVNNDSVGANLLEEGLQLGEFICNKKHQWLHDSDNILYNNNDLVVVMGATCKPDGTIPGDTFGTQTDGIFSGVRYYCYNNVDNSTGLQALNADLKLYQDNKIIDAVKCIFMIPKYITGGASDRNDHLYAGSDQAVTRTINSGSGLSTDSTIDLAISNIDGYTPKNNKLFTSPFCYLLVSNNNGTDVIYKYENFYTISNNVKTLSTPKFTISSCLTPSGSVRMVPNNYKGVAYNDIEGINLGKFPICSWDTDVYTNWLTQNGVNVGLKAVGGVAGIVGGVVTGTPTVAVAGALAVAKAVSEVIKEPTVPPQAEGNINSGDVVTATGENDFHFHVMTIKAEQAKIIDDYFTAYGYRVNALKVPNINGRTNWNYIKTLECNVTGTVPEEDINKIKEIFNKGITIWHNPLTFMDYSQTNSIVS